ncbi:MULTISPECIES: CDF family Co(II)/Ni(II) efflux transporter DmeF [Pseudoalteromonas]|jgi:cation diffusion facilitator family transporter|uniref:CDF family Co(II)/Ni(II) efflux transporter DmeF n=3 Tax=Pseudoalteromonas TaxID=53246 RepID=UPI0002E4896F|nr:MULTISPECIES: CDF family Co(II)/Ni(II) efflux transporter DmeF [Pseudoalteromonas]PHQ94397.1 MAG: cation transporter [Pseudoalteromonas sp.]MDN3405735.1 CDF family Co(II)/Ni(II) efflux transporter DmeF [Pseudoalteromonas sp. APC 3218]MDN3410906.1 CDF family Co(II)/Ni(II) efflux transporter DmeF [Pseudoalteromonas sp. APC 3894]MDN3418219.1 CDF family Co(II)/Ni(II) efflux transporter DmeF [Pseudoalteromonas sp. APC 3227]MDN3421917.1 CDF family Co(II)/Ni(II) efflux transporter DmeF [Pseudoalte|tara:strand:- start:6131 stop:7063 length:933 start_codon:yes stop_codon:yes gene_type:complete
MREQAVEKWGHTHHFAIDTAQSEKKVTIVFAITTLTMVIEIVAGTWFGSMALLADGWHMFTHSAAFAVSIFVYWYSKKHRSNREYSFGVGKVNTLGGFASAVALGTVALMMIVESVSRLFSPQAIRFDEAIGVAIIGLIVNVVSAVLLHDNHHHHGQEHHKHTDEDHSHDHHDHNLKAAYFHVLADTLTSVFAIVALVSGKYFNWLWADALMGIVGAIIITKWAYKLLTDSSNILLDKAASEPIANKIVSCTEEDGVSVVTDLHLWKLSSKHLSAIVSVATPLEKTPDDFKDIIRRHIDLSHLTIEVNKI